MRTSRAKTLWGILIGMLGVVALLVAVVPDKRDGNITATQDVVTFPASHSSIRFSERTVRLAPVHSGESSSGFVLVENAGSKVITEVAIRAGCWCSDVTLSEIFINPGESIKIYFSIDTRGKYEDFTDNFIVTYSEEGKDLFDVFYATVPILAPGKLVAEPASLQFSRVQAGATFTGNIALRIKDLPENESVDIVDISVPDWISVSLVKQDARWELVLTGVFPNQLGRYVEFVQVKSNSQLYSEMVIPIIVEYGVVSAI